MQNKSSKRIRFDLKGSFIGRRVTLGEDENIMKYEVKSVLKDANFIEINKV